MQATVTTVIACGGISIESSYAPEEDGWEGSDPTLAAGQAGTLTTRTDDNTGEATLSTGHGILTGDTVDVYWSGGLRYGMTVGIVAGNVVPIDGGTGDVLPAQTTALVVCKQTVIEKTVDGDDLTLIAIGCANRCHVAFFDSLNAEIIDIATEILAGTAWSWLANAGGVNPLAGHVLGKLRVSNGEADAAKFNFIALFDSTP